MQDLVLLVSYVSEAGCLEQEVSRLGTNGKNWLGNNMEKENVDNLMARVQAEASRIVEDAGAILGLQVTSTTPPRQEAACQCIRNWLNEQAPPGMCSHMGIAL